MSNKEKIINSICIIIIMGCLAYVILSLSGTIDKFSKITKSSSCADLPEITSLSKEKALNIERESFTNSVHPTTFCDFLPKELNDTSKYYEFNLANSHTGELTKAQIEDNQIGSMPSFFDIDTIDNSNTHYSIIISKLDYSFNPPKSSRIISFKKDFFDINYRTTEIGDNYHAVLYNTEPDFVEWILRIISFTSAGNSLTNLWKYHLKDTGNTYEFTFDYTNLAIDEIVPTNSANGSSKPTYKLDLSRSKLTLDKTTGNLKNAKNPGLISIKEREILKSYPLTDAEFTELDQLSKSRLTQ